MPRILAVLGVGMLASMTAGCYPLLTHPTRVSNGAMLTMAAGGQIARFKYDSAPTRTGYIPNISMQLVVGARDSLRSDAVSTRFALGTGMSGWTWGAYAELPEDALGDTDIGIGVNGQDGYFDMWTTYLQFGRRIRTDRAWLVSQGVSWVSDSLGWSPVLSTTLGLSAERLGRTGVLFVTFLLGNRSVEYNCVVCFEESKITRSFIIIGVSNGYRLGLPAFGGGRSQRQSR